VLYPKSVKLTTKLYVPEGVAPSNCAFENVAVSVPSNDVPK